MAVLSGFAAALAAPWIHGIGRGAAGWLLALLPFGLMMYFARFIAPVAAGDVFVISYAWVPSLGLNLSFLVDGLSLLFALLISGIGALIVIYAGSYLAGHHQLGRFYAYLLVFMASMLGLVLADNVIALFVFWEATSISSYLLIGFDHHREAARAAGLQALLVTGAGGLTLLAGVGVVRMPDLFTRMQAATKASTLGMSCMVLAVAVHFGELGITTRALATMSFVFFTAPVAAHMIARAAYFVGVPLWEGTMIDELRGHYDRRTHSLLSDALPAENVNAIPDSAEAAADTSPPLLPLC